MLDVYRMMQLLVDKAVSHSCKPNVFKLQKIPLRFITHYATPQRYKMLYYRQHWL